MTPVAKGVRRLDLTTVKLGDADHSHSCWLAAGRADKRGPGLLARGVARRAGTGKTSSRPSINRGGGKATRPGRVETGANGREWRQPGAGLGKAGAERAKGTGRRQGGVKGPEPGGEAGAGGPDTGAGTHAGPTARKRNGRAPWRPGRKILERRFL
ncbi:hypothetical protein DA2_3428 [Desulfovibrio sp. A2]|nr:hypothetical protein DA2_3428 [Desulfovibrio sp. A2]